MIISIPEYPLWALFVSAVVYFLVLAVTTYIATDICLYAGRSLGLAKILTMIFISILYWNVSDYTLARFAFFAVTYILMKGVAESYWMTAMKKHLANKKEKE